VQYIERVRAVTMQPLSDAAKLRRVRELAKELVSQPVRIATEDRRFPAGGYGRNLLYKDPDSGFVVIAMVWPAGQGGPPHDHGCWGVVAVAEGEVLCARARPLRRRTGLPQAGVAAAMTASDTSGSIASYLAERPASVGGPALLSALSFYSGQSNTSLGMLCVTVGMLVVRPRRAVVYTVWFVILLVPIAQQVLVLARGPRDLRSDRDEAVEISARALLTARNPWLDRTPLNNAITTGPTSILIAAPAVACTGDVQALSLAFWSALLLILAACDIFRRNDRFLMFSIPALFALSLSRPAGDRAVEEGPPAVARSSERMSGPGSAGPGS
jgi:hypothetical protein